MAILPTPVWAELSLLWSITIHYMVFKWPQVSNWLVTFAGVSNLVINLIKAQKTKGSIHNFSKLIEHWLVCSVSDTSWVMVGDKRIQPAEIPGAVKHLVHHFFPLNSFSVLMFNGFNIHLISTNGVDLWPKCCTGK